MFLLNLPPGQGRDFLEGPGFVLGTCLRTLVITRESDPATAHSETVLQGREAYGFALEVLCGLRSKIPGEGEVAAQFKRAYRDYAAHPLRDTQLLGLLETLLKDAKKIRTEFLKNVGGQSYGAVVRKILLKRGKENTPVLIKGTGALAASLLKLLKKHFPVALTGRDRHKRAFLSDKHGASSISWSRPEKWQNFSVVVNTIGAEEILFADPFFVPWQAKHREPLYIDLGSPSVLQTSLSGEDGVLRLEDIFQAGHRWRERSLEQLKKARQAVFTLAEKREERFVLDHWHPRQSAGPGTIPQDCPPA